MNEIMVVFEFIIILLLILECWLLWYYAQEHTLLLDLIRHNIGEIKKHIRGDKS